LNAFIAKTIKWFLVIFGLATSLDFHGTGFR
jgi:hypothetical protein